MPDYVDIKIRCVKGYGYLPIVDVDGEEVYRGEFKENMDRAFKRAAFEAVKHQIREAGVMQ